MSALLVLVITANFVVILKLKVYQNFNSMCIMLCLTVILMLRLVTYLLRVIMDKYSHEQWVWYRISTDIVNYLLGTVAIVLLMQWHQTYTVLSNPLRALKTMEKNWAKVAQIALIVTYTVFMVFDIGVVIVDSQSDESEKSSFVLSAYKTLIWLQSSLSLLILIGYVVLFVFFLLLMRKDRSRFGSLHKHVIGFFSLMLLILIANFVLDIIFYDQFDKTFESGGYIAQDELVSVTMYIHTGVEILFDIVLLSFLISQSDRDAQHEEESLSQDSMTEDIEAAADHTRDPHSPEAR